MPLIVIRRDGDKVVHSLTMTSSCNGRDLGVHLFLFGTSKKVINYVCLGCFSF